MCVKLLFENSNSGTPFCQKKKKKLRRPDPLTPIPQELRLVE